MKMERKNTNRENTYGEEIHKGSEGERMKAKTKQPVEHTCLCNDSSFHTT